MGFPENGDNFLCLFALHYCDSVKLLIQIPSMFHAFSWSHVKGSIFEPYIITIT